MAEAGLTGRVVGISCDGTGFGPDGAIWGGEVLVCDEANYERFAHLRYFPLIGGDAAAKQTWRPAAGWLAEAYQNEWRQAAGDRFDHVGGDAVTVAAQRLAGAARLVQTSSLGRLFDAAAFLLGVCDRNRYEAEAAMQLEALAQQAGTVEPLAYHIETRDDGSKGAILDTRPVVRDLIDGTRQGRSRTELASAFHETIAAVLAEGAVMAAEARDLDGVAISGGCFANAVLLCRLKARLEQAGLAVYVHREVPTGDGGIALGQAVAAAERLRRR
jgi:hydrogenase maturation protein HypF